MFSKGMSNFYKQLVDWKGVSKGLLPVSFFSYYSPYVFSHVIKQLFKNYQLEQQFGVRSYLSAYRAMHMLNDEIGKPISDPSRHISVKSWKSFQLMARFLDCKAALIDGNECSSGQGLCFFQRPYFMNITDYLPNCPSMLQMKKGDCPNYPPGTICCNKPYRILKFGGHLEKNEFNEIVVAIHRSHHVDNVLISDLVKTLTNSSKALYRATGGRSYFRTITIVSSWNDTNGNATYEDYNEADFKVVPPEKDVPMRALQTGHCGVKGLGVLLSHHHLRQHGSGEMLAKMFSLHRWGIGDETASNSLNRFSVSKRQNNMAKIGSSCSSRIKIDYQDGVMVNQDSKPDSKVSFAFRPDIFPEANAEFCATTTIANCDETRNHNSEPNTPHNVMCNRTSTLSAILQSPDFDQTQNTPRFIGNPTPTFKFVKYSEITDIVLAIVVDISGSIEPKVGATMLNSLISFLQIAPDEVKIVLVRVAENGKILIQTEPVAPLEPFVQPTGGLHFARQQMIEKIKSWFHYISPEIGPRDSSVTKGVKELIQFYQKKNPNVHLKILVLSDFMGIGPSDNELGRLIRLGGYSIWPVAVYSKNYIERVYLKITNSESSNIISPTYSSPTLYEYFQNLANSTLGRWQVIPDPLNMEHWFSCYGTYLNDLNLAIPVKLEATSLRLDGTLDVKFRKPEQYNLNTSIVVNYDSLFLEAVVTNTNDSFSNKCIDDYRGYQAQYRLVCRLSGLPSKVDQTLSIKFGKDSSATAVQSRRNQDVTIWILSRAIEYGKNGTGATDLPYRWQNPWVNRRPLSPGEYFKGEAKLALKSTTVTFERSAKFNFPIVTAILSVGSRALLNCTVGFDLHFINGTTTIKTSGKMYDDGRGEDTFENDGVYSGLLSDVKYNGTYTVNVKVAGESQNCFIKTSAIVGKSNDQTVEPGEPVEGIAFFKSAGSFDVTIPNDAIGVFYLGRVMVKNCGVRNESFVNNANFDDIQVLPESLILFCRIEHLAIAQRYNVNITYHLSVSSDVSNLLNRDRFYSNASRLIEPNQNEFDIETGSISGSIESHYYAVVWAHDNNNNYASRSEVILIATPTREIPGMDEFGLPNVDFMTTMWPVDENVPFPTVLIVSCIVGLFLAVGFIITMIIVLRRKQKRLSTTWVPSQNARYASSLPFPQQPEEPVYNFHLYDNRPGPVMKSKKRRAPEPSMQGFSVSDPNMGGRRHMRSGASKVNNSQIYLSDRPGHEITTARRQNSTNAMKHEQKYFRATDNVNRY